VVGRKEETMIGITQLVFRACNHHQQFANPQHYRHHCHDCLVTSFASLCTLVDLKLFGDEKGVILTDEEIKARFKK